MLKKALHDIFRLAGIGIIPIDELSLYRGLDNSLLLFSEMTQESRNLIAPFLPYSRAQLGQDLFALSFAGTTKPSFFVEFGATDGEQLSNTWMLEKILNWDGILAEPAKVWHDSLVKNRSCNIDFNCVAGTSGRRFRFLEVDSGSISSPELSGIENYARNGDWASSIRFAKSRSYEVNTISLNDLLEKYNAPFEIQFLSIDTEGSELDILKGFDFSRRKIQSICVEHNYVEKSRNLIRSLLLDNGYKRVYERLSKWDDWYILRNN